MNGKIRILIVDDHDVAIRGISSILSAQHDMVITGHLTSGAELVKTIREQQPDVVLLDLLMADFDFYQALDDLNALDSGTRIIIISSHLEPYIIVNAEELGVSGYLSKEDGLGELLPGCIRDAMRGDFVASDKAKEFLFDAYTKRNSWRLSGPQYEVLCLLVEGHDPQAISQKLGKKREAVYSILKRIRGKFGVQSNLELAKIARDQGLVPT